MKRKEFLKLAGLIPAAAASIKAKGSTPVEALDDVVINRTDDPAQYTVPLIRDHAVQDTYAHTPFSITLNDEQGTSNNWELVKYSDNLENLNVFIAGSIITSQNPPGDVDIGKEYEIRYMKYDPTNPKTGINRIIRDEIDRYRTIFVIKYKDQGVENTVEFEAPNSVTKDVMGWNPNDPIVYLDEQQLSPTGTPQLFVEYFTRLHELLTLPEYRGSANRIRNRNTPVPVPQPNPAVMDISLLRAISEGDVTIHDDLYPTLVTLYMTDFSL